MTLTLALAGDTMLGRGVADGLWANPRTRLLDPGPNMTPAPGPYVHAAAKTIEAAGATLVAGHSAHVPQGVRGRVLFDLRDFLDDYHVDCRLRNDLSMLWLVTLDGRGLQRVEGLPVRLEYARTRPADSGETRQLLRLLEERCAATGSRAREGGLRRHRPPQQVRCRL
jgi:poly-gamma-glutamate synthesis protein (capsule biosynthesis protein)